MFELKKESSCCGLELKCTVCGFGFVESRIRCGAGGDIVLHGIG